jgi:probable F420-dependent oxidoreductase
MRLGQIGAWCAAFTVASADDARPAAAEIEALGYETLWYPEGLGTRESFTNAAVLLAATDRIRICSGIANIWARDAVSTANAARVLADAFDDRFLLGLGVSHPRQVDPRGHLFVSPDGTAVTRPPVRRVLAALRPPMLRLAAEMALGAHTFLVPVEHTRRAREILGPEPLLVVEQKVVLGDDLAQARDRARSALGWYLDTPNYVDNLRWLGFSEDDLAGGGSDTLAQALVVAGDEAAIEERCRQHLDAGASQVAIQPLEAGDPFGRETFRRLAPVLL